MSTLATLVVSLTTDARNFGKGLSQAERMAQGFRSGMQGLGKAALAGAAGAVTATVGAVGAVINKTLPMAADFQSQLANLGIAAKQSGLSFQELHDAALAVGGDTDLLGVSATGAADSMTGLYKAGLSTSVIFGDLQGYLAGTADLGGALRASIDTAAATTLDMVQASDLAAVALSTFGAELETDAQKADFINAAMNNMVQAADASVAEVDDLAAALKNVGPTAASLGVDIFDVNNALAILSTRGINGAEAGTALKSMLANMQRPTAAVQDALDDLNVSLYDAEGAFVGLPDLVGQLEGAFSGLTDEQRSMYAQTLAGTFGMNALNTLLGEGVDGWNEMADATADAAGIQEQAAAKANTFSGMMEALEGSLETVGIQLGEAVLPAAETFIGTLGNLLEQVGPGAVSLFEGLGGVLETAALGFDSLVGALLAGQDPMTALQGMFADIGMEQVADGIGAVASGIEDLVAVVAPYAEQIASWIGQHVEWSDVLVGLGAAVLSVVIPAIAGIVTAVAPVIGAFVAIVAAVAAVRAAWESDFAGIRSTLTSAWAAMQPVLATLVAWFQQNLPAAIEALGAIWSGVLLPYIQQGVENFRTFFRLVFSIANVITAVLQVAIRALVGLWQNVLLPAIKKVVGALQQKLQPAMDGLAPYIDNVKKGIEGISLAIEAVIGWFKRMSDRIRNVELPEWLTPGSPTPLEIGLRGIASAASKLARTSLPAMSSSLAAMPGENPAAASVAAGGGGMGGSVWNGDLVIDGAGDPQAVADAVIKALQDRGIMPATGMLR